MACANWGFLWGLTASYAYKTHEQKSDLETQGSPSVAVGYLRGHCGLGGKNTGLGGKKLSSLWACFLIYKKW